MVVAMAMSVSCAGGAREVSAGTRRGVRSVAVARAPGRAVRPAAMPRMSLGASSAWARAPASSLSSARRPSLAAAADMGGSVPGEDKVTSFETEEEFDRICGEAGDKLVVLDISTKTCGPCKMIFPYVCEMAGKYDNAVFLKIQGDATMDTRALMKKWGIRSVPTFRFYKKGELVHSHTGAKKDVLQDKFDEFYTA